MPRREAVYVPCYPVIFDATRCRTNDPLSLPVIARIMLREVKNSLVRRSVAVSEFATGLGTWKRPKLPRAEGLREDVGDAHNRDLFRGVNAESRCRREKKKALGACAFHTAT